MPYKDKRSKLQWQKASRQKQRQESLNSLSLSLSLIGADGTVQSEDPKLGMAQAQDSGLHSGQLKGVKTRPKRGVIFGTKRRLSKSDVWALHRVGINPAKPLVSQAIRAMVSELEAVRAHLDWHHQNARDPIVEQRLRLIEAWINRHDIDHLAIQPLSDVPIDQRSEYPDVEDTHYHDWDQSVAAPKVAVKQKAKPLDIVAALHRERVLRQVKGELADHEDTMCHDTEVRP